MEAWDSTGAVYSGSYSLADDVAGAQSDYETRHGAHSRRAGSRRAPMVPALEVFDRSAVCPLRHKGPLCWGAYGSSVGLRYSDNGQPWSRRALREQDCRYDQISGCVASRNVRADDPLSPPRSRHRPNHDVHPNGVLNLAARCVAVDPRRSIIAVNYFLPPCMGTKTTAPLDERRIFPSAVFSIRTSS